jgi:glutaredoxin 3
MSARVVMYRTATCPYCRRAETLLRQRGVTAIEEIDLDRVPGSFDEMVARTGRRTWPQIFIGERHVGGCDDLHDLDQAGELVALLQG